MAQAEKSTVVITPAVAAVTEDMFTLTLNEREAQVLTAILAHTNDTEAEFPEVRSIYSALKRAGAPEYYGVLTLLDDDSGKKVHVRVANKRG